MKEKNDGHQAIGLDVGTSRIVVAERHRDEFRCRARLNAFVAIPATKMAERALAQESVPYLVRGGEILIFGDESEKFADLFHLPARRPMSRGILNPSEPDGLSIVRQILGSLFGDSGGEGKKVCFSVPAPALGAEDSVTYHEAAVGQLLGESGYDARSINEGLAVIYAELDSSNFTGIGISFGGGLSNVCLAYLAAPLFSFSVPKGGDFIDASVAGVTNELETRIRIVKETSFHFNGNFADKVQQALGVYYRDMIDAVVSALKEAFANGRNVPKIGRPVPVILSGGSALAPGFRDRFAEALSRAALPVSIADVKVATDPLNATAKGALVAALAEV